MLSKKHLVYVIAVQLLTVNPHLPTNQDPESSAAMEEDLGNLQLMG